MKSFLVAIIAGIVLFAASAGASWYLMLKQMEVAGEVADPEEENPIEASVSFPRVKESDKVEAMPVALRPEVPVTVEAVTELAQSIMKKEQALLEAQKRLKKEKKRIELLFEDLRRERDELSAFGQRIDAKVIQAREVAELLKLESQSLEEQSKALAKLEKKTGKTSADVATDELDQRVSIAKKFFRGQEPEEAAKYLKEFANRGELEFAARLLDSLEDRQIAKILAAFNDAPLVAQIIDAYTKKESSTKNQRLTR